MHLPLSILYVLYQSIYYTPDFISYEERLAKFVQSCTWCKPKTATNPIRGLLKSNNLGKYICIIIFMNYEIIDFKKSNDIPRNASVNIAALAMRISFTRHTKNDASTWARTPICNIHNYICSHRSYRSISGAQYDKNLLDIGNHFCMYLCTHR